MYTSKSYNRIIKSTGLFGGVQIINILISIIRSKITALLLGPSGVGLYGLFQSLATTIQLLTGLGIGSSAVKFVASGANSGDGKKLAESISSLRLWALATGIFGVLIMVCLSGTLSRWMFGNKAHATGIALISVTLLFTSISNAQLAILQGIRDLRSLAKVSVFGQFSGLFFILPLYWLLGEKGIVPAYILTSFIALLFSWYFSKDIIADKIKLSFKEKIVNGTEMVKLGIILAVNSIINSVVFLIIRKYINTHGGILEVGLFQAGYNLCNTYVGFVFTAIATDYFPALSGVANSIKERNRLVCQQLEVGILIILPIIIFAMTFLPIVIIIFLSDKFLPIVSMVQWSLVSVLFKMVIWSIGYLFLAVGDYKTAFIIDNVYNLLLLISYIVFYNLFGVEGLGICLLPITFLTLIINILVGFKKFSLAFSKDTFLLTIKSFFIGGISFCSAYFLDRKINYYIGSGILFFSLYFVVFELNKRIPVKELMQRSLEKIGIKFQPLSNMD